MRPARVALRVAAPVAALLAVGGPAPAQTAMANPASVFCMQRGGRVEIETTANGAQNGVCVFADGRRIDEWAYFRNNHRTTAP